MANWLIALAARALRSRFPFLLCKLLTTLPCLCARPSVILTHSGHAAQIQQARWSRGYVIHITPQF